MNQEFYSNNRSKLASICPDALIVVAGNSLMQRTGDTAYTFRQDSNLLYLTGVSEPNICLVIDTRTGEEFLMVESKVGIAKIFDGELDVNEIARVSGIKNFKDHKQGAEYIVNNCKNGIVWFNEQKAGSGLSFMQNNFRQIVQRRLKAKKIKFQDIRPDIAKLRMYKQPAEIALIEKAILITKNTLQIVEPVIVATKNEAELLTIINTEFARNGVIHAYEPIVASGKNATTLHYIKNNSDYRTGDVVLFDIGAEVQGYAADISRTYNAGAKNQRSNQIIAEVTHIQNELIAYLKPGVTWKALSELSEKLVGQSLMKLGIITTQADTRKYFPHAIGHFLGLDVHDAGDYSVLLAENMVITIEPGIYVPEESIGVRIEDDILITKTGSKML